MTTKEKSKGEAYLFDICDIRSLQIRYAECFTEIYMFCFFLSMHNLYQALSLPFLVEGAWGRGLGIISLLCVPRGDLGHSGKFTAYSFIMVPCVSLYDLRYHYRLLIPVPWSESCDETY